MEHYKQILTRELLTMPGYLPPVPRSGREKECAWFAAAPPGPADAPPAAVPGLQVPFGLSFANPGAGRLHT